MAESVGRVSGAPDRPAPIKHPDAAPMQGGVPAGGSSGGGGEVASPAPNPTSGNKGVSVR